MVCTSVQVSATLTRPTVIRYALVPPLAWPALTRASPTAASSATPELRTMSSERRMLVSSRLAWALLCSASSPHTATRIQVMSDSAAASQPMRMAACHGVNCETTTPTTTPTALDHATRTPARDGAGACGCGLHQIHRRIVGSKHRSSGELPRPCDGSADGTRAACTRAAPMFAAVLDWESLQQQSRQRGRGDHGRSMVAGVLGFSSEREAASRTRGTRSDRLLPPLPSTFLTLSATRTKETSPWYYFWPS